MVGWENDLIHDNTPIHVAWKIFEQIKLHFRIYVVTCVKETLSSCSYRVL